MSKPNYKIFDKNHSWDEIDQIENDLAQVKKNQKDMHSLWDRIDTLSREVSQLKEPQSLNRYIKLWIKKWLGV